MIRRKNVGLPDDWGRTILSAPFSQNPSETPSWDENTSCLENKKMSNPETLFRQNIGRVKVRVRVFFLWHNKPNNEKATEETNYLTDKLQLAVIIKILMSVLYFKMEIYRIVWAQAESTRETCSRDPTLYIQDTDYGWIKIFMCCTHAGHPSPVAEVNKVIME